MPAGLPWTLRWLGPPQRGLSGLQHTRRGVCCTKTVRSVAPAVRAKWYGALRLRSAHPINRAGGGRGEGEVSDPPFSCPCWVTTGPPVFHGVLHCLGSLTSHLSLREGWTHSHKERSAAALRRGRP